MNVNREAVMLASLASLSELQESFQFLIQELSVDEEGIFTPIQGDVPDTKVIADGLVNAKGFGGRRGIISISGGGSGKCPPRPRPWKIESFKKRVAYLKQPFFLLSTTAD